MYGQTLLSFSNIQLEQLIHFLRNPFFIHPAIRNATPLFEQLSKPNHKKYIIIKHLFQELSIVKTELTCSKICLNR